MENQKKLNDNWFFKKASEKEVKPFFNIKNRFKNEKEMGNYIENNIELFCDEILDDDFISYKREYRIFSTRGYFKKDIPNARIDFYICCKNKNYAIELKNPNQSYTEMSRSIGQMMLYDLLFHDFNINAELILISSSYSDIYIRMLKHFNLNYRFILFNKKRSAELVGYDR